MNFGESRSWLNNSHFPGEERKKKKAMLKKRERSNQSSTPSRRWAFSKSDEDIKCLCSLSCPKTLSSKMDGLDRGQKSWLSFPDNSLYGIPFRGFGKGRKQSTWELFSSVRGRASDYIWLVKYRIILVFGMVTLSATLKISGGKNFVFSDVLLDYCCVRLKCWFTPSNFDA